MAFCNKCGATIGAGTRFCNQCGTPILASTLPGPATGTTIPVLPVQAPPAPGSNSALKVVLIIVGIVAVLGILGLASAGFVAWRIAHHTRVHQDGDNVKVETPFGNVESTKDPEEVANNLGVDLYPGAEIRKNGANSASFGGFHTVSLTADTDDPVDRVSAFYKSKFPNAMVTTSDSGHCTIVSNDHKNIVTIVIESAGDKTKIQISNVHKGSGSDSSSN
jgi:hypothetical protein